MYKYLVQLGSDIANPFYVICINDDDFFKHMEKLYSDETNFFVLSIEKVSNNSPL